MKKMKNSMLNTIRKALYAKEPKAIDLALDAIGRMKIVDMTPQMAESIRFIHVNAATFEEADTFNGTHEMAEIVEGWLVGVDEEIARLCDNHDNEAAESLIALKAFANSYLNWNGHTRG